VLELTSRLARLFWGVLDRIDCAVMRAKCCVVDHIYGSESPIPADLECEAEYDELKETFPMIRLNGTIAVDRKPSERQDQSDWS
jgi:hypothetical protein